VLQFVRRDVRERLVEFKENGAAHARLHPRRARILRRGALRRGVTAAPQADLEMIAPVLFAPPAAVHIDDDLMIVEFQLGDLHAITGI